MAKFKECEKCGAALDPGETCDCMKQEQTGKGVAYEANKAAIQEALEEQKKGLGYVVDCTIEETELVRPMVNGGTHITEFLVN